ncbi:MAG TPA: hypothetical protein ENJ32_06025 [Crenotrichaceae bacterium]|nr:hypothetical protein [Crenotrichaceae bacterium]
MFKSTSSPIGSLSPAAREDILKQVPDATLVLVLDKQREVTPIAINPNDDTKYVSREEAEKKCQEHKFAALSKSAIFNFGVGSGWCLVDVGGGNLVWVWHP